MAGSAVVAALAFSTMASKALGSSMAIWLSILRFRRTPANWAPLMKALYHVDPETPEQVLIHSDAVVEVISAAIVNPAETLLEPALTA